MVAWLRLLKARTLLLFWAALVPAGLALVFYLAALFVWQYSTRLQGGPWVKLPATLLFSDHAALANAKAAPVLEFIPDFHRTWVADPQATAPEQQVALWVLEQLHVGLGFALAGLMLMALGVLGVRRQNARIRLHKQGRGDRARRMQDYQREGRAPAGLDGRREPYIGPPSIARHTDRRVA